VFGPVSFSTAGGHPTARAEAGGKQRWLAFDGGDDDDNGGNSGVMRRRMMMMKGPTDYLR
jgi:hypothetical protein